MVRGSADLPHGVGKKIRVAVFARGNKAEEARRAGATIVGAEEYAATHPPRAPAAFDSLIAQLASVPCKRGAGRSDCRERTCSVER